MAPVLEIENLTKRFGRVTAVDNLSLSVDEGDVVGFLGPNGAGKTTTMACSIRLIKPTSGSVRIFGKPVRKNFLEIFRKVGCLVEAPAFYPYLSGKANLEVLARCGGRLDRNEIRELIELVGLGDAAKRNFKTYSTGMRARLGFSVAIQVDPDVLLVDEVLGVGDQEFRTKSAAEMKRLIRSDKSVILVSHNTRTLLELCDRLVWIENGVIKELGATETVLERYSVPSAKSSTA